MRKVVVPQEIMAVKVGETAQAVIGLDFGAGGKGQAVKFDVKTDRGSYSVSLEVPVEERLTPLLLRPDVFDKESMSFGGFQKTTLAFEVGGVGGEVSKELVLEMANVAAVDEEVDGTQR